MAVPDDLTPLSIEGLVFDMLTEAGRLHEDGLALKELPAWLRLATEMVHERFHGSDASGVPAATAAVARE